MMQTYAYPSCDRFIGMKTSSADFDLYSGNSGLFKGFKDSNYSELIRKNLFG